MGILDYFSNVICAFIIIIFNFFLLSFNYSVIDIVLNSVASLFVIELDDSAVFLSSDSLQDLLKQQLIDELIDERVDEVRKDPVQFLKEFGFPIELNIFSSNRL